MDHIDNIRKQRERIAEAMPERIPTEHLRAFADKILMLAMSSIEENLSLPDEKIEDWPADEKNGYSDYFRAQGRIDFLRTRSQQDAIAVQRIINQREVGERETGGIRINIGDQHRIGQGDEPKGEDGQLVPYTDGGGE